MYFISICSCNNSVTAVIIVLLLCNYNCIYYCSYMIYDIVVTGMSDLPDMYVCTNLRAAICYTSGTYFRNMPKT